MLLEGDEFAPYGWSHCLTLPQAVLRHRRRGAGDPSPRSRWPAPTSSASARRRPARPRPTPPEPIPASHWRDALDADRATAAAAAWHAPGGDRAALISELATRASIRHDAHLVKYTLACIDAAADDPAHARLFLAAAASLGAWWQAHGDPDDM